MHQVLFTIPTPWGGIPIFGFGLMLFLAFAVGTWLAARRARAEGINPDHLWDVAMYLFAGGVVGARVLAMFVDPAPGGLVQQLWHFIEIWKGGMVFYGGIVGAVLAYVVAYFRVIKPNKINALQLTDVIAPSLALGIFLGRLGCFLNGCCYGDVADPARAPWAVRFPGNSNPQRAMVSRGYQNGFGFYLVDSPVDFAKVEAVEKRTPAAEAGLAAGDQIVAVGEETVNTPEGLYRALLLWPQGEQLRLTVERDGTRRQLAFDLPLSLPLHPTQLYSALDGLLLTLLLLAYYPLRKRPGELLAIIFLAYPLNRFLIEKLRSDTPATYLGYFTLSQAISLGTFALGVLYFIWVRRRPLPTPWPPTPVTP